MSRHGEEPRRVSLRSLEKDPETKLARYGRLYQARDWETGPHVPPEPDELGRAGGALDGGTSTSINPVISAGYVFLGQFIAHDVTFDATTLQEQHVDSDTKWNYRTPRLDLDSVYGAGPRVSSSLYEPNEPSLFLLPPDRPDVPREQGGVAVIADPRNDQTLVLSQLHYVFLRFHNNLVQLLRRRRKITKADADEHERLFDDAYRIARWHYQWVVVHDYLCTTCRSRTEVLARLQSSADGEFFGESADETPAEPYIPVEFSHAAFRFGHSQVGSEYRINSSYKRLLFPSGDYARHTTVSKASAVDWRLFFHLGEGDPAPQPSRRIDTAIAGDLFRLPDWAVPGGVDSVTSVPARTLRRSVELQIASGQDAAGAEKITALEGETIWRGIDRVDPRAPAPLWFYLLREAEEQEDGKYLGELGSRIVTRVLVDLVRAGRKNKDAVHGSFPENWTPTLRRKSSSTIRGGGTHEGTHLTDDGRFEMADLIEFALSGDPGSAYELVETADTSASSGDSGAARPQD